MYIYVELWKAKRAWLALGPDERKSYLDGIGPAMAALAEAGVEVVSFALNDDDTEHRADYRYVAVWTMPDKERALQLEQAVVDSGFYDYFEQVNARGDSMSPDAFFGDMASR